jgi:hypothetical protein
MTSYFVAAHAPPRSGIAVHDRSLCPPGCFLTDSRPEYLGEFLELSQAIVVARLRYPHARGCACCEPALQQPAPALLDAAQVLAPP